MSPEELRAKELNEEFEKLAKLNPLEYEVIRQDAAKRLGVRMAVLDQEVGRLREEMRAAEAGSSSLDLPEVVPWQEPVDGAALLEELGQTFRTYVSLPLGAAVALPLWVVHAYAFEASYITPRLVIGSPEKRCGKTALLRVIGAVVPKKLMAADITAAAMFRAIETSRPTLLIDEGDIGLKDNEALRGVINSGHGRDGAVYRAAGENHEPKRFSTFAPVAIALIGSPADTIKDRSVVIRMRRRRRDETVERLRLDRPAMFDTLRRRCARWAADNVEALAAMDPEVPHCLNDRAADNWRPLLAIADRAGEEWSRMAREAAMLLSIDEEDDEGSARTMLLTDIRSIFDTQNDGRLDEEWRGRIRSGELCDKLAALEDRPWNDWHRGKPMTPRDLAFLLKSFEIKPKDLKSRYGAVRKGYDIEDFRDAFDRYLPPTDGETSATEATMRKNNENSKFRSATGATAEAENGQENNEVAENGGDEPPTVGEERETRAAPPPSDDVVGEPSTDEPGGAVQSDLEKARRGLREMGRRNTRKAKNEPTRGEQEDAA